MSTTDNTNTSNTSKTGTPHKVPAPDGKSNLPSTLPDFPGPVTTPPPTQSTIK
jgi:hypothetical protein